MAALLNGYEADKGGGTRRQLYPQKLGVLCHSLSQIDSHRLQSHCWLLLVWHTHGKNFETLLFKDQSLLGFVGVECTRAIILITVVHHTIAHLPTVLHFFIIF